MRAEWFDRFRQFQTSGAMDEVLTCFNANIDKVVGTSDFDLEEVEQHLHDRIENEQEMLETVAAAEAEELSIEVETKIEPGLDGAESVGGQAGIAANFLASRDTGVIFYTSILSDRLSEMMDERILFPTTSEGRFELKNVKDCSNSDRTKVNTVVEYPEGDGRLILSSAMKGFGPFFRKGIEENLRKMEANVDRAFMGGFHDAEGNVEAKLEKARRQLSKLEMPIHLEYVRSGAAEGEVMERIVPEVDSIGMDETEAISLASGMGIDPGERLSLGEAFQLGKRLIHSKGLRRVHVHTFRYHAVMSEKGFEDPEETRESMIYGSLSAARVAGSGRLDFEGEVSEIDPSRLEVGEVHELRDFQSHLDLENFTEEGIAEIKGIDIVAIPPALHSEPERLVGLGDVISASTWSYSP